MPDRTEIGRLADGEIPLFVSVTEYEDLDFDLSAVEIHWKEPPGGEVTEAVYLTAEDADHLAALLGQAAAALRMATQRRLLAG